MLRTRAFVLRSRYLSNLKQISIYTERFGLIHSILRIGYGEFPLKYDNFSLVDVDVQFLKNGIKLHDVKLMKPHMPKGLKQFVYLSKISKAMLLFSLSPNKKLFELLSYYSDIGSDFKLAYVMFITKMAFLEGVFPRLSKCISCNSPNISFFSVDKGGVLCSKCRDESSIIWSKSLSETSKRLAKYSFSRMVGESIDGKVLDRIAYVFENHMRYRLTR